MYGYARVSIREPLRGSWESVLSWHTWSPYDRLTDEGLISYAFPEAARKDRRGLQTVAAEFVVVLQVL